MNTVVDLNNDDVQLTVTDLTVLFKCGSSAVYTWVERGLIEHEQDRPGTSITFRSAVVRRYFGEEGYDPQEILFTLTEVGEKFNFDPSTIQDACRTNRLKAIETPSGLYLIRQRTIDAILNNPAGLRPGHTKPDDDELVDSHYLAAMFHAKQRTIGRWAEAGLLPYICPLGKFRRFWKSVGLSFLNGHSYDPSKPFLTPEEVDEALETTPAEREALVAAGALTPGHTPIGKELFSPTEVKSVLIQRVLGV